MAIQELLTNESLRGIFKNNFELAHYAIRLSRHYIHAGHELTLGGLFDLIRKNPNENFLKILEEIEEEVEE